MKNICYITTSGKDFHRKAIKTASTLPQPFIWFTDDCEEVTSLLTEYSLNAKVIALPKCQNQQDILQMCIRGMFYLIDHTDYEKAVYVDTDCINRGGVERLLETNTDKHMLLNAPWMGSTLNGGGVFHES